MKILAVIPARGGSKGIPRKNLRLLCGRPLISYAIGNARACLQITDVAVTSDDDELLQVAEMAGAVALRRAPRLAEDHVTLDPVICDAVEQMERRSGERYDVVITLQPTSPVLRPETLSDAVARFLLSGDDTWISAVNKPHLAWTRDENGVRPLYEKRLNRQQLPPNLVEAGAFVITKRAYVTENSRFGPKISVCDIPEEEAIDIDNANDWMLCEHLLSRKRIVLRCDGYKAIGMGHIYHCLTLFYNLTGHEVRFVTRRDAEEGVRKLRDSFVPLTLIDGDEDFFSFLREYRPDIVVNDCLDTRADYVQMLKALCPRVVTIEDMGEGTAYADAVINALYETPPEGSGKNIFCGRDYVSLRDEFLISQPAPFRDEVKNILVLFGGTDPANLTAKTYAVAKETAARHPQIAFTFITGIGYDAAAHGIVSDEGSRITVLRDVRFVSACIAQADLAVTSQGRTVYELAVMGVPAVVMAQNRREQLHTFAQMRNGFLNLGLGETVEPGTLGRTLDWLVETPQIRREMRELMLANELRGGVRREIRLILGD